MKLHRIMLAAGLLAVAACSSPTAPRLPQPEEDPRTPPPDKPGVVAVIGSVAVVSPVTVG